MDVLKCLYEVADANGDTYCADRVEFYMSSIEEGTMTLEEAVTLLFRELIECK